MKTNTKKRSCSAPACCSDTAVLHAGYDPSRSEGVATVPIFTSSTDAFSSARAGKRAFHAALKGKQTGELIYARLNHPNAQIVQERLAMLEPKGGMAAVFTSGMSAIATVVGALLPEGKELLFSQTVYGGTYSLFIDYYKERLGMKVRAINTTDLRATRAAIRSAGKNLGMLFLESPANPTMAMTNIAAVASLAKLANPECMVVVDNTFMGIFQPVFLCGADVDVVVYSATKFLGGHSNLTGGVAITRHGCNEVMAKIYGVRSLFGTIMTPFPAWQLLNHVATYRTRMESQANRATELAGRLSSCKKITNVMHPSLLTESDPDYAIYKSQCTGPSSIISFRLKHAGERAAFRFLDAVASRGVILLAVSLGCVESLIEHPATMTHSEMSRVAQLKAGITPDLVRLSVGVEDVGDIWAALSYGLSAI